VPAVASSSGPSCSSLGFAIPFVMLGSFVAASTFLATTTWVQQVLGVVVIALGLLMASGRLMREFRFMHRAPDAGLAGAPILGFVFGVGWTPCIGPAAGAILTLAGSVSGGVSYRGAILGFLYAFGLGVPFILFGLLFNRMAGPWHSCGATHARSSWWAVACWCSSGIAAGDRAVGPVHPLAAAHDLRLHAAHLSVATVRTP
jgi:cytochrome c biogenesis protein CcdA